MFILFVLGDYATIPEASALIITSDRPAISFYENYASFLCKKELKEQDSQIDTDKMSITISNWLCNDVFALIRKVQPKRKEKIASQKVH